MATIRVWAPRAALVELESEGRRLPMIAGGAGWWSVEAPLVAHGVDYAFRIDGQGPFPDPRSAWQPSGVHGPSRWLDHSRHQWTDTGWRPPPLAAGVIYELHVGTFTPQGTFDAACERLDHLVALGVTHVELMPVAAFFGDRGWGYDGVLLFAPHEAYGGPEGLKRLVEACHRRGLAVLLDVVYNHLGPSGNYLDRFGPYFTDRYRTPWGPAVNLDGPDSDEVRRFIVDNALMWLRDYRLDGLRIDAVHAIFDTSAIHLLEELAGEVRRLETRLGRHLTLIAESDLNDPRVVRPVAVGGHGLDAQWNEDFHHALHAVLTGERNGYYRDFGQLADLQRALTAGLVYDGRYSAYRRRRHGRPAADLGGASFVGCLQNHDQIGNRAGGERTSDLLTAGQLKIGAALVLCGPFVPMLFQGEEWAAATPFLYFIADDEPTLAEAVRRGRQEEFAAFGWRPDALSDPADVETFARCRLDWDELEREPHRDILAWHRALIALRRGQPDLAAAARLDETRVACDETAQWLTMTRGRVVVACNLADRAQRVPCDGLADKTLVLASEPGIVVEQQGVALPAHAVAILAPAAG